ncbi:MAG: CRISPR system precrRNA processing endoribonuclease RAMP protein Cas6 [Ignavibacteriales bacterium]|nr:CRISPR system precrRNA processing endoribonuclease RAMP protein Cas6 [Ignavibacteriales bacterium]
MAAIPHSNFPGDLTNETVELIDISEINACPEYSPSQNNIYNLKFLTPLRMERKEADKQKGKRFFDTEYFDVQQFFKLLYKRISDLYKLNFNTFPTDAIPENPAAEIIEKCFIWVDMPNETHTFDGIIGTIKFKAELNDLWKRILHFGQLVHVGQRSAFGFGKYVLIGDGLEPSIVTPVKTFLDLTLEKENLHKAFYHIKSNSDFAGVDGISPEFFELSLKENLENLIKQVQSGEYQSEDLQGVLIPKSQSKIRALAIPAVKDRLLQRAVVQILSDPIDHLLEENSFAFRKGLSRAGAARAINQARKNGYHFVVESDIQSFFDTVNWELLFKKLDVLYGYDPICDIIKKWVQSDVVFKGIKIKRFKGLPQGAVISPLLANLFLDEFDEALQNDFKLIRYADDFVLLCKSKEQAEEALEKVKSSLKNIDLQIAPSKTNIVSFDQGFQYLGYLFVKSIIIEKSAAEEKSFLGNHLKLTRLPCLRIAGSALSTLKKLSL